MKFILPLLISWFCLLSIESQCQERQFTHDGISFEILPGWRIIAEEKIDDTGYYFSAESTEEASTGMITVTWIDKLIEPDVALENMQTNMKGAGVYDQSGIQFTGFDPTMVSNYHAIHSRYVTLVENKRIEGSMYTFNCDNKTVTFIFQTGTNDQQDNQKAFDFLLKTFAYSNQ